MKKALVLIDIQKDYFPGGRMPLVHPEEAAQNARRLVEKFRAQGWPVYFIQHISTRSGASFFLPGTEGIEFTEFVSPLPGDKIIQKHFPNSFRETSLLSSLMAEQPDQLVICGMMTHMCVDATTRAGYDLGFGCQVAGDACATRELKYGDLLIPAGQVQGAFLSALDGTYAQVMPTAEILKSLEGKAD